MENNVGFLVEEIGRIKKITMPHKIKKSDLLDLDITLAKIILPYLVAFKKMKRTGFTGSTRNGNCKSREDWEKILNKMIWTMKEIVKGEDNKEIDEGLRLFGEFFRGLWY